MGQYQDSPSPPTPLPEARGEGRYETGRVVFPFAFAFPICVIGAICGKQKRPRQNLSADGNQNFVDQRKGQGQDQQEGQDQVDPGHPVNPVKKGQCCQNKTKLLNDLSH